ncbi:MAG: hypothetical protein AAGC64_12385 [Bacteroidota bacterium]
MKLKYGDELKFYWKGIAYDDQFSLIDRLHKLYQIGMQRFLGEDVVYISADQIDKAFDFFKNDPDATKDTIKKYFKELKFSTTMILDSLMCKTKNFSSKTQRSC